MFDIPAIAWGLTAVLVLGGTYHLLQAARARHFTDRVNEALHVLMNAVMAGMVWNLVPATMLAQITALAGAALWFLLQAVARPEFKLICAGSQGRIKCAYHAATMAGAALMVAMMGNMTGHGTPASATPTDQTMPMGHKHHAMTTAPQNPAAALFTHPAVPAMVLTALFGTAAVVFTIQLLRHRKHATNHTKHPARAQHGLEAAGATAMALMFATMAA